MQDALIPASASIGLLVVLSVGGLFVLDALDTGSYTSGEPGTVMFVLAYVDTPEGISIRIWFGIPVGGGLLGLARSSGPTSANDVPPAVEPGDH